MAWEASRFNPSSLSPITTRAKPPEKPRKSESSARDSGRDRLTIRESAEMRRRAVEAIRAGDFQAALKLIRDGARVTSVAEKQSWLLVESELEIARKNYAKAGLAAMRVVILYPESEQIGPALYWCGCAYEGLGRPRKALELYRESQGRKGLNEEMVQHLKLRIEALEKQVGE